MRYVTISLAAGLCALALACKTNDLIRLEPTIEEERPLSSSLNFRRQPGSDQLVRGFFDLQDGYWRWTAPQFEVILAAPKSAPERGATLILEFSLPDPSIAALKNVTLSAKVNRTPLAPQTYSTSGEQEYRRDVLASAFVAHDVIVDFSVDKFLTPRNDGRNLALVATGIRLEPK